jgi:cobalt/nickel transport system permease protein
MGVPALATTLMLLAQRYVEALSGEGIRMVHAFTFRGRPSHAGAFRQYASFASALTLRAAERSERIAVALKARNFNGELPIRPLPPMRWSDAGWVAASTLVILLVTFGRL